MLGEDLTPFFNPAEHAVEAILRTAEGVELRRANVILSTPVQEVPLGQGGEVAHLQPSIQCPTVALDGIKKGSIVEVVNVATYTVVRRENDGTGISTAWLRKQ